MLCARTVSRPSAIRTRRLFRAVVISHTKHHVFKPCARPSTQSALHITKLFGSMQLVLQQETRDERQHKTTVVLRSSILTAIFGPLTHAFILMLREYLQCFRYPPTTKHAFALMYCAFEPRKISAGSNTRRRHMSYTVSLSLFIYQHTPSTRV